MIKIERDFRWWLFHVKLRWIARFIEKHKLYTVTLDKELLQVWKKN